MFSVNHFLFEVDTLQEDGQLAYYLALEESCVGNRLVFGYQLACSFMLIYLSFFILLRQTIFLLHNNILFIFTFNATALPKTNKTLQLIIGRQSTNIRVSLILEIPDQTDMTVYEGAAWAGEGVGVTDEMLADVAGFHVQLMN